jgi:hypothetical protein
LKERIKAYTDKKTGTDIDLIYMDNSVTARLQSQGVDLKFVSMEDILAAAQEVDDIEAEDLRKEKEAEDKWKREAAEDEAEEAMLGASSSGGMYY